MRGSKLAALTLLALAGCAGAAVGDPPPAAGPAAAGPARYPHEGDTMLSVLGTPFLIAFKIPVCIASAVIAAPLAGASALAPASTLSRETRRSLADGLAQNCGGPYVVEP